MPSKSQVAIRTAQHARTLGTQHWALLSFELKMMGYSKSLLLAALTSVLLFHFCSRTEGKCHSFCSQGRKNCLHFPLRLKLIWVSPEDGSLLESFQKGVMGVVSSLVSEGRKGSCCWPGFLLCCQSQRPLSPRILPNCYFWDDVNWVALPMNEVILKCKECSHFPNFLISQLNSFSKTHYLGVDYGTWVARPLGNHLPTLW